MIPDMVTDAKLSMVIPDIAMKWRAVRDTMWAKHELQLRVTEGLRTFANQWALWSKGRLKEKDGVWHICDAKLVVTHAMPGQSYHQYGMALDSCFHGDDPYLTKRVDREVIWNHYGKFCKSEGLEWGGDWSGVKNDRPHCQSSYGLSITVVQNIYEEHGLKAVWEKCKAVTACGGILV